MKKSTANAIINLWNKEHANTTNETKTKAVLCEGIRKGDYDVEIVPNHALNDGISFYSAAEMVYVGRAFRVSFYVTTGSDGRLIGRLF